MDQKRTNSFRIIRLSYFWTWKIRLNIAADCHERLGNPDKAKAYFRRSLELNPNQEGVKARLAELSSNEYF